MAGLGLLGPLRTGGIISAFVSVLCCFGCSVPNLENPQCTAARAAVKKFYSFHFDNAGQTSVEIARERAASITSRLSSELTAASVTPHDYFTDTETFPKAFRVGECSSESSTAHLEVILLWRDNEISRQEEVKVRTVLIGDKWLIDEVSK